MFLLYEQVYDLKNFTSFPPDLASCAAIFAEKVAGYPHEYRAEAAIVNYYPIGTTLSGNWLFASLNELSTLRIKSFESVTRCHPVEWKSIHSFNVCSQAMLITRRKTRQLHWFQCPSAAAASSSLEDLNDRSDQLRYFWDMEMLP